MRTQVGDIVPNSHRSVMNNFEQYSTKRTQRRRVEPTPLRSQPVQQPAQTQQPTQPEPDASLSIEEQERQLVFKTMLGSEIKNVLTEALKGANLTQGTVQNSVSTAGSVPTAAQSAYTGTDPLYLRNARLLAGTNQALSQEQQFAMRKFVQNYQANKARYEAVAEKTDMPPELIAALHWRESTGNFGTYLHQGDPLGKPARNIPNNIPVFHDWESAAIHAINLKKGIQQRFGITKATGQSDPAALSTYAEYYNGKGYFNKSRPSPYVFSGTSSYQSGKYVADGKYDPNAVDRQLGVYSMLSNLWSVNSPKPAVASSQ
jgi:lysozyme family protein